MDAATNACVFYMQQRHHDDYFKPPNYFECHDLNRYGLSRDRQTSSNSSSSSSRKNSTSSSRNFFKKNKDITIREEEQQNLHKEDEDDDDPQTPPPLLFPVSPASTTAVPDFQDSYEEKSVAVATSFSKKNNTNRPWEIQNIYYKVVEWMVDGDLPFMMKREIQMEDPPMDGLIIIIIYILRGPMIMTMLWWSIQGDLQVMQVVGRLVCTFRNLFI
jgi:hypothetical protein